MKCEAATLLAQPDALPFDHFADLRANGPVVWDDALQGWLVLSYDLCRDVFRDEESFAHNYAQIDAETLRVKGGRNIVTTQGEPHDRLHRWAVQIFSPRNLAAYRDQHVAPVIDSLFSAFAGRRQADLRRDLCEQVPGRSMMAMMGMAWADDARVLELVRLHETIMVYLGKPGHAVTPSERAAALAASGAIDATLLAEVRERRDAPGEDLLSRLWAEAPERVGDVDETVILANARELFLGGFDTTVHALSNGIHTLLVRPDLQAAVRTGGAKALDAFIEEVLRVLGVVQHRMRIATVDTRLGDVAIAAGDRVIPVLLAANRDPEHFGEGAPDFDLERRRVHDHLAFITGPRTCPGSPLARMEMKLVFTAFFERLENPKLDPAAPPPVFTGAFTRSWRPLNVTFNSAR